MEKFYHADEASCIEAIRNGDEPAFEHLFKQNYERLIHFGWGYTASRAIAEEIAQDVFAEMWEKRKKLDINGTLRAYLYMKVKNRCLNYLKREKIKDMYDPQWVEQITAPTQNEDRLTDSQLREAIKKAVEQLPPKSKLTFKLHRFDGLTYPEIAQVLDVSPKTVESQMTRTLKMLRELLSHLMPFFVLILW